MYLAKDFLPYVVGPMGCDWGEDECLIPNVTEYEITVHGYACSGGGLTVEVA